MEAAKILGVNPETLRRWDRAGKLKAKRNPMNNYRLYSVKDIESLKKQIAGE
jgi:DNA-binding transcriptional MerR regulator